MTRKDYILIANMLNQILIANTINLDRAQFDYIVDRFAKRLGEDNPAFDERKFRKYAERD